MWCICCIGCTHLKSSVLKEESHVISQWEHGAAIVWHLPKKRIAMMIQESDDTTCQVRLHNVMLDCPQRSLTQLLGIVQIIQNRMTTATLGYNDPIQNSRLIAKDWQAEQDYLCREGDANSCRRGNGPWTTCLRNRTDHFAAGEQDACLCVRRECQLAEDAHCDLGDHVYFSKCAKEAIRQIKSQVVQHRKTMWKTRVWALR